MTTPLMPARSSRRRLLAMAAAASSLPAVGRPARDAASASAAGPTRNPVQEVEARERAFAATMASRDLQAFAGFVSEEAVFLGGPEPLTGRTAIVRHWARFFTGAQAPFSWAPDLAAVLASGRLATTGGPVTLPDGSSHSRFYSTWRLEDDGAWRVVFDHGTRTCPAAG